MFDENSSEEDTAALFDKKHKKQKKIPNANLSELSQSEVSTSDERNNMVDDISVECDNSVNNNDILDERNNQYENSLVNEYEYNLVDEYDDNLVNDDDNYLINDNNNNQVIEDNQDNQDNTLRSILQSQPKNMSKTPNLKEIKLIPIINHSGRSWIWSYYQRYEAVPPYKTIVSCLVEVHKNNKSELCGHLMGSVDSSTGNYIGHLATRHGITESSHNKKIKQPLSSQLQIDKMIYGNPERKRRLDQKFVELLIKDQQPLNIRNNEGLTDFIAEFDPSYQFPSKRFCRQLLSEAYENTKQSLLDIFEKNIISCSLTCNLWTGHNRLGYLGVTCSYVDTNFQLQETILSINHLPYPHTGEIIAEALNSIINEWNLSNKVFFNYYR